MDLNEYRIQAIRTECDYANTEVHLVNNETQRLLHALIGLCTEVGEVQTLMKKHLFYSKSLDIDKVKDELGDIMWYWILACDACKIDPEKILHLNIQKLKVRYTDKFSEEKATDRDLEKENEVFQ